MAPVRIPDVACIQATRVLYIEHGRAPPRQKMRRDDEVRSQSGNIPSQRYPSQRKCVTAPTAYDKGG